MIGNLFAKLPRWFDSPFLHEPISVLSDMKDFKTKVLGRHIENFGILHFKHSITVRTLGNHLLHAELIDLPNRMLRRRRHIRKKPRCEKFIPATTLFLA